MDVQVLSVRAVGKGLKIAHVRAGEMFGDCPASEQVSESGPATLRVKLIVREGRLAASLRVEPKE